MINVCFDNIIYELQRTGGISRYWSELLGRAIGDPDLNASVLEGGKATDNLIRGGMNIPAKIMAQDSRTPLLIKRYCRVRLKMSEPFIFHSSYYRLALGKNVKNIVTVHDLAYERCRSDLVRYLHLWQKRRALRRADIIIAISQTTAGEIMRCYPETVREKIRVVHLAASRIFTRGAGRSSLAAGEYLLYVGQRQGYKNFNILLKAWRLMRETGRELPYLVAVGGEPALEPWQEEYLRSERLADRFIFVRNLSDSKLNELYNHALALVYPSRYEGFGIPILEAFQAGCPVICSMIDVFREIAQEAALYFPPDDPDGLAACVKKLRQTGEREARIEAGTKRAQEFSWEKTFIDTKDIYRELADKI
jgi:glycosyltransferase involved in cell wall biosynthesis